MSSLHLHRERVLLHVGRHAAPPSFYSSSLSLERLFCKYCGHWKFPYTLEGERECSVDCNLQPLLLNASKSYTFFPSNQKAVDVVWVNIRGHYKYEVPRRQQGETFCRMSLEYFELDCVKRPLIQTHSRNRTTCSTPRLHVSTEATVPVDKR